MGLGKKGTDFGSTFYPLAGLILSSQLVCLAIPGNASLGLVITGVTFQLFDIVTWYASSYIVQSTKTSAIFQVASMRVALSLGVTISTLVAIAVAHLTDSDALPASLILSFVAASALTLAIVFPPRRARELFIPIPDEDDAELVIALAEDAVSKQVETIEECFRRGSADASGPEQPSRPVAAHADVLLNDSRSSETAPARQASPSQSQTSPLHTEYGRWKTLCLALGDEVGLTEREKEVFVLLAKGRGSQSISDALTISLYTMRAHTRNIYAKLDVHSRHELSECAHAYVKAHLEPATEH